MVFEETSTEAVFAANLRDARNERGMTQAEVAEEMSKRGFKWHPPTVYKVENGERQIQLGEALELARILGRSLDDMSRPTETSGRRRVELIRLWADVADPASAIVMHMGRFKTAVRKLRAAVEETPDLETLIPDEEAVALIRWHINSDFTTAMETVRYDPPEVVGDVKRLF